MLNPGQSMIQNLDGNLCYTAKCSQERDPSTGFFALDVTVVNCSQKCEDVSIAIKHRDEVI